MNNIDSMAWLTGNWTGALGPMAVEETWMAPLHGMMEMMIRVSVPDGIQMTEFIVIREITSNSGDKTLLLHLRQFSPTHELLNSQEMSLVEMKENSVSFSAAPGSSVTHLDYIRVSQDRLRVQVTVESGDVMTADLERNG